MSRGGGSEGTGAAVAGGVGPEPRVREHHVVAGADGRPALIYDIERTRVTRVAPSDAGPTPGTVSHRCLDAHAIVTAAAPPPPAVAPLRLAVQDVSLDVSGRCNMSCGYCFEADIGARRGVMADATLDAVAAAIVAGGTAGDHLVVHFASGEPLTAFDRMSEAVRRIEDRARIAGRPVAFSLTTNATLVTPAIADMRAAHAFTVKVSLDGPAASHDRSRPMQGGQPSYARATAGLERLADRLPATSLSINTVVRPDTALGRLWDWVQAFPVGRWVTVPVGETAAPPVAAALVQRRRDLARIADDIATAAEAGVPFLDYEALTKVVRRLAAPAPTVRFCGAGGSFVGIRADGGVYPCLRQLGVERYRLGDVASGLDPARRHDYLRAVATPVDERSGCRQCWARYLCGGGCYADAVVYGDSVAPLAAHCDVFRLEIEAALGLFDRLRVTAPLAILGLFGKATRQALEDEMAFLGVTAAPGRPPPTAD